MTNQNRKPRKPLAKHKRKAKKHLRIRKHDGERKALRKRNGEKQSADYNSYMTSQKWYAFRSAYIKNRFGTRKPSCELCPCNVPPLTLHHKHYETLTVETFDDMLLLCERCHCKADKFRETITKQITKHRKRLRSLLYNKGFYLYAHKKHGPSWRIHPGEQIVLNNWLRETNYQEISKLIETLTDLLDKRQNYNPTKWPEV